MGKGINNGSADTKARERTWAGHEGNFGEILKILAVCLELVVNIRKKFLGEVMAEIVGVLLIVES